MTPGVGNNNTDDAQSDITFLDDSESETESEMNLVKEPKLQMEKEKYVKELLEVVGDMDDEGRPLNILLIGCPGVGKSSFINTVAAALSGRWREHSYSGWHGQEGKAVTVFASSFPRCCMDEQTPHENLPTLIDLAGVPNEDNERWEELLRIILYGRLLPGESITSAYNYCDEFGVIGLRKKYCDHNEALKVDRVIFLSSATEPIPNQLIDCMLKAARPFGSERDRNTRTIPVFGVLTKIDKIELTNDTFMKRESDFIHSLGLGGAKHRYLKCANYCDDVDNGDRVDHVLPELDIPVLRFLKQVCDPVVKVINPDECYDRKFNPETLTEKAQQGGTRKKKRTKNEDSAKKFMTTALVIAIEAVVIAVVLHWFLQPPFDVAQMVDTCEIYETNDRHFELLRLDDLCSRKMEWSSRSLIKPFLGFVFIRIATVFLLHFLPTYLKT